MKSKVTILQMKKGMLISISAQIVSLIVSIGLNLIIPKFIDEYQYANWQIYIMYIGYVGILHFGLLDGIFLRYSQYDFNEIDKKKIRSQFLILFNGEFIIAIIVILITTITCSEVTKSIIILVAIGIITRNIFTYTSYSFQITNRINKYAILIITQRLFYGIGITILLLIGYKAFFWFCIIDLSSDLCGILLGTRFNKGLYFGSLPLLSNIIKETKVNISSGILLLISNWSSNLLIGCAKMIVRLHWDVIVFGKIAFAFSISNLFLNFITAIGVVLFPSIKRMNQEELPALYKTIRDILTPILFIIMLFYFPGCWILRLWIPKYAQSLTYLGILLPIIVFTSKTGLLTNNYLKAYRKEKSMLKINLFSICIAITSYMICAYVLNSINALLVSIVLVIMIKSILSEISIEEIINVRFYNEFIIEGLMTVIFIFCARYLRLVLGCVIYAVAIIIYMIINRKQINVVMKQFKWKRQV